MIQKSGESDPFDVDRTVDLRDEDQEESAHRLKNEKGRLEQGAHESCCMDEDGPSARHTQIHGRNRVEPRTRRTRKKGAWRAHNCMLSVLSCQHRERVKKKHWTKPRAIPTACQQRHHVTLRQHEKGNEERSTGESKAVCRATEKRCCHRKTKPRKPKEAAQSAHSFPALPA